jgi:hypothetical protein
VRSPANVVARTGSTSASAVKLIPPTMVIRMGPLFDPTSELRDEPSALGPLTKTQVRILIGLL